MSVPEAKLEAKRIVHSSAPTVRLTFDSRPEITLAQVITRRNGSAGNDDAACVRCGADA
jgi:hypothetical protein